MDLFSIYSISSMSDGDQYAKIEELQIKVDLLAKALKKKFDKTLVKKGGLLTDDEYKIELKDN